MRGLGLALAFTVAAAGSAAASPPFDLDACAARVAGAPRSIEGYRCFRDIASREGRHEEAFVRVEAILLADPENDLARWALAALDTALGARRAEALFEDAISGLAQSDDHRWEARARLEWAGILQRAGRADDASAHLDAVRAIVRREGGEELAAELAISEAWQAFRRADHAGAETALERARAWIEAEGGLWHRATWLSAAGAIRWARGQWTDSLDAYRREAETWSELGNRYDEAAALANVVLLTSRQLGRGDPSADERRQLGRLIDEAEDAARASGNLRIRGSLALYRAQLTTDLSRKRTLLEQAVDLLRRGGDLPNRLVATRYLAELFTLVEPPDLEQARALLDQATRAAYSHGDLDAVARGRIVDASLAWRVGDEQGWSDAERARAIELADRAIEAIEALRDLQADDSVRAATFSTRVFFHERMIGHLLGSNSGAPTREDIAKAFEISERMRARVLLERLDTAGVPLADPAHADAIAARRSVIERAARTRVELSNPFLDDGRRAELTEVLDKLAAEEAESRARLARQDSRFGTLRAPSIPALGDVERAIGADEAILAFTTGTDRTYSGYLGGGSWLLAHSSRATRAYRVPPEEELEAEASLYAGLFESRNRAEERGAARLYERLLRRALDNLGPGVSRLVIIPDGPLHRVPFAALRPDAGSPRLAARFSLSSFPSVATWLRRRREPGGPIRAGALVVADPLDAAPSSSEVREEAGALPHARREARLAVRSLHGRSRILEGERATEASLKKAMGRAFGVLHVAAHARLEDERTAQASILLAPGADGEDGRLTVAEASRLDLRGRVVVLAACRTAGGPFLEGEGVQSLSRGFLAGGARAVVGSLWPLRDDETAEFFGAFYRRLGGGAPLGEAFAGAQRERIAAGAAAASWAGLVLVGDDSARLDEQAPSRAWGLYLALLVLLIAGAAWFAWRRRAPA